MKPTPVKVRRKFDETFKREAVNNGLAGGRSAEGIGQELGLDANRLYAWKKRLAPADAGVESGGRNAGRSPVRAAVSAPGVKTIAAPPPNASARLANPGKRRTQPSRQTSKKFTSENPASPGTFCTPSIRLRIRGDSKRGGLG